MKKNENTNKANQTVNNPSATAVQTTGTKVTVNGIEFIKPETATATVYNGEVVDTVYSVKKTPCDMAHNKFTGIKERAEKVLQGLDFATEFDALQVITKHITGVTNTTKNVRIKVTNKNGEKVFINCWRRATSIRVYTNTPQYFKGVEWQAYENPNEPFTHVSNTNLACIIQALDTVLA